MKAWLVRPKDDFGAEIVFAETRGKARALALSTEGCEDVEFTDVEVCRAAHADKYYKEGKWHLDWNNPKDRIILVKECDFYCEYMEDCEMCSANKYCEQYQHYLESEVEE